MRCSWRSDDVAGVAESRLVDVSSLDYLVIWEISGIVPSFILTCIIRVLYISIEDSWIHELRTEECIFECNDEKCAEENDKESEEASNLYEEVWEHTDTKKHKRT
jgi:hypothetical protein